MTALRSRLEWPNILIALLVALAVIFFNWLVWRAQWPLEIDGNEAWNAYQVDRLAAGLPLYPPSDALIANNYPPLSFILAHWLTRVLSFDAIIIGRCLSLLGILITAAGCGFSTRVMGGGAAAVTLSVAWYVAAMSRHFDIFAGMNDPQIFAGSIMMAGMVCFIVAYRDRRSVIPAFALMVLARLLQAQLVRDACDCDHLAVDSRPAHGHGSDRGVYRTDRRRLRSLYDRIRARFSVSIVVAARDPVFPYRPAHRTYAMDCSGRCDCHHLDRAGAKQLAGTILRAFLPLRFTQSSSPANRRGSRHELAVRACHGYSHRPRTCVGRHRLPSSNVTYGADYYPGRRYLALASDFSLRTLSGPDEPDVTGTTRSAV